MLLQHAYNSKQATRWIFYFLAVPYLELGIVFYMLTNSFHGYKGYEEKKIYS